MNQNIFETRQRANELLSEALKIWQRSEKSEYLEGLDTDPVFKMLINALAYQTNELESEIAVLKDEILDEFEKVMVRGEGGRALPALSAVSAPVSKGISEVTVDSGDTFLLDGLNHTKYSFTTLFRTRLVNASVTKVTRMDSRRWSVTIEFPYPVTNLSGFSFAVDDFHHVGLSISSADSGQEFPVISPWDYAAFTMADFFSMESVLFNRAQAINTGGIRTGLSPYSNYLAVDLFTRSMVCLYVFGTMPDFEPTTRMNLIFNFTSTSDEFEFKANSLKLNVLILVNAYKSSVSISSDNLIAKITGEGTGAQFLGLLHPDEEDLKAQIPIHVRRIGMERFNEGRLLSLLQNLIVKFKSDYYAFESIGSKSTDAAIGQIQKNLSDLIHQVKSNIGMVLPGTYVYLDFHKFDSKFSTVKVKEQVPSVKVNFLLTDGEGVNSSLKQNTGFLAPPGVDSDKIQQISDPIRGMNEILDKRDEFEISRYYLATEDRILTPFDVKMFCYTELKIRYGIVSEMVSDISVLRHSMMIDGSRTYTLAVTIKLKGNEFIQRAFAGKIEFVEAYLSKMIWSRTTGAYPVRLKILI